MISEQELRKARGQIQSHARKHARLDSEDLTENSLVEAIEHYKPERGKFPTFAFLVYKRNFSTYWTKRSRIPSPVKYFTRTDINNMEVARLYLQDKLSLSKIGKIMNCDPVTIMDRLERMGIARRPRNQKKDLPMQSINGIMS